MQTGDFERRRYANNDQDLTGWRNRCSEGHAWCGDSDKDETASTITERSYFPIIPVLVNARMTRKSTNEILSHFKNALEFDIEEPEASLSDEEFGDT